MIGFLVQGRVRIIRLELGLGLGLGLGLRLTLAFITAAIVAGAIYNLNLSYWSFHTLCALLPGQILCINTHPAKRYVRWDIMIVHCLSVEMTDTFCSFTRNVTFVTCFLLPKWGRNVVHYFGRVLHATVISSREAVPCDGVSHAEPFREKEQDIDPLPPPPGHRPRNNNADLSRDCPRPMHSRGGAYFHNLCMHIGYVPRERPPFSAPNFRSGAYNFHKWPKNPVRSITILYFAVPETIIFKISLISTRSSPPTAGSARKRWAAPRVSGRPDRVPARRVLAVPETRIFTLKTTQARSGAPHFHD